MRRLALLLTALGVVGGQATATAQAGTTQVGISRGVAPQLVAAPEGSFAFMSRPGVLGFGTSSGRTRELVLEAPTCGPRAAASTTVLVSCEDQSGADRAPRLLDTTTATIGPAPGAQLPPASIFYELGRFWIGGQRISRGSQRVFIDRRTGEVIDRTNGFFDVNDPSLMPLRRPMQPGTTTQAFTARHTVRTSDRTRRLQLVQRGRRTRTLSACRTACTSVSISERYVAWTEGRRVFRYRLGDAARRSWAFAQARPRTALATVAQDRRLLVAVPYGGRDVFWRVFSLT